MPPPICELCATGEHQGLCRELRDLGNTAVFWGTEQAMRPICEEAEALPNALFVVNTTPDARIELWLPTRSPGDAPSLEAELAERLWPGLRDRVRAAREATPDHLRPA